MRSPPGARWRAVDGAVLAAYLCLSLYVMSGFRGRVRTGYLSQGVQDQQAFEWYFGASAHNVLTLANPLFSDRQNFPDGVNLMANAAVIGLGIPLTPVTEVFGAHWTFFLVELLGLAGTAAAWYWLFRRRLAAGPLAAGIGAGLVGFSPAMVSHANGHPNFVAAFVVPVIVDRFVRLSRGGRPGRDGLVLGLLLAWQVFIGEEVLLLTALGLLVLGAVLLAHRRLALRAMLPGLAIAAAVSAAIVAVPLWWQFFGPQGYTSLWHPPGGNDLAALWGRATRTVGADPWASAALSMNRTEENAFLGALLWPLAAAVVVALVRRPLVQALALLVVLAAWLSLGEEVLLRGVPTAWPSLWGPASELPVLGNVLPTRFTMVAVPAIGALLALGIEAAGRMRFGRAAVATLAAVALAPVFPTPLVVDDRPPVPAFFTTDAWRDYAHGGSFVAAPPTDIVDARAMDWQREARMGFPIAEGYFVGPGPETGGPGQYGAVRRPLSLWLYDVTATNTARSATPEEVEQFRADLRAWQADAVVLPQRAETAALLASLGSFLGPPDAVAGVLVWDVREFRAG